MSEDVVVVRMLAYDDTLTNGEHEAIKAVLADYAALGEIVARISAAAIDPAVERAERLDLIQSILIDWLRSKQR